MVTLPAPARLPHLKRSLADYCRQTHHPRELIVVLDAGTPQARAAVRREVEALGRTDIRVIAPDGSLTLGALRNISLAQARGEILSTWDDDDFHHPERIERQLAALLDHDALATCLQEILQYFPQAGRLYLTNWSATPARAAPPSLMWRASAPVSYPEKGPEARLGEDVVVIGQLQALGDFHCQSAAAHLYVYVSHGGNTCSASHHQMLAERLAISRGLIRRREGALREGLAAFDFGPAGASVEGSNGPAFELPGRLVATA
jgi:hypothetical protein